MKKWQVALFLAGWLVLGLFVTAVNNLGTGGHGAGEHTPTAAVAGSNH
ncbi:MAG: hypothetical protein PWQ18_1128 [Clostridia bacterium]|nr:hypothetical protein [Clostridia bacterium]